MFKVLSNLQKSWISVIIFILLLVLQAAADLALPDYTSKIVNIGIQQSGIETSSPEVIRKTTMESLLHFAKKEEAEEILENYTLISKNSSDYNKYIKKYPLLEKEELYVRNAIPKEELQILSNKMAKPFMIMQNIELLKQYSTQIDKTQIENIPESIVEQAAIAGIKEEYKAIGINTDKYQTNYILWAGLQMLGVSLASIAAGITIMLLSSRVAARLGRTLREKIFKKVLGFSTSEFKEFSTASLITRSTNDIQQIQSLINMLFRVVFYAPIIGIGGFFKVLATSNNTMSWIIGVAIGSILIIVGLLFAIAMPKFKKMQTLIDKLNLVAREMLTGIPVIRAFHTEKKEEARFEEANKNLMKNYMFVNNSMNLMMPILMLIMNCISLLTIWAGAHSVDTGAMQVGDIMAFLQYTMQIVMAFLMISMISIMLPRASVSAKRINEVLDKKNSIQDPKEPKCLDSSKKGIVEFKNVSFRYPDADEDILTNIDFIAKPR